MQFKSCENKRTGAKLGDGSEIIDLSQLRYWTDIMFWDEYWESISLISNNVNTFGLAVFL